MAVNNGSRLAAYDVFGSDRRRRAAADLPDAGTPGQVTGATTESWFLLLDTKRLEEATSLAQVTWCRTCVQGRRKRGCG